MGAMFGWIRGSFSGGWNPIPTDRLAIRSDKLAWRIKISPTRVIELKVTWSKRLWQLSMYGWEQHYSLTQKGHWSMGGLAYVRYVPHDNLHLSPHVFIFPMRRSLRRSIPRSGLGFEKGQGITSKEVGITQSSVPEQL